MQFLLEKMMRGMLAKILISIAWIMLLPFSVSAAVISFTTTHLGGAHWIYDYTLRATTSDPVISEVTIFFDQTLYSNLAIHASPLGWDSLVIQPDASLASDGFFDTLAPTTGLAPGMALGGFQVSFDFFGTGTPAAQHFNVVDPDTFEVLSSGLTSTTVVPPPPVDVPEPDTLFLVLSSMASLLHIRLQGKRAHETDRHRPG